MRIPWRLCCWLDQRLQKVAGARPPNFVIGPSGDPYMLRWWIIPRNRWFNIYLHHFLHSDEARALHDHPWWNLSCLLSGEYTEHTPTGHAVYRAGDLKFRRAEAAHRVELHAGTCWSLFLTGPVIREWGFLCPQGWRHWKEFVSSRDKGQIGRGCD